MKKTAQVVKGPKLSCSTVDLPQHRDHPQHSHSRRVSFTPSDTGCVDCDFESSCTYGFQQSDDVLASKGNIDNIPMQQTTRSAVTADATSSCGSLNCNSSKTLEVQQFPRHISSIYHEFPVDKHDNFDFDSELGKIFQQQDYEESDECNILSFPILEISFDALNVI
jgi:hypothetical protein